MRLFTHGKIIAGLFLGTKKIKYFANPAKYLTIYLLSLSLFCFGARYVYFIKRQASNTNSDSANVAIAALLLATVLLFQLVKERKKSKTAEKKSEIIQFRFEKIYNGGIVGLLYTLDGVIIQANDYFLDMIGYSQEDVKQGLVSWKRLTPEDCNAVTDQTVAPLRTQGSCGPFEKEFTCKNGSTIRVMLTSAILHNDDLADAVTYVIDITHKQEARYREEHLNRIILKQKEEFQRLLMNAPAMISLWRGPELRLEFINQLSMNYSGNKDYLGLTLQEIAMKLNMNTDTAIVDQVYQTGERFTAKAFHLRIDRTGNGQMEDVWFDFVLEPLLNENGAIDGVASFSFDVTKMIKANIEIKESEARFRFLADSLPHKIWTSGPDGRPTYHNKGWYDYLQADDFIDLDTAIWNSIHPDELAIAKSKWDKAVINGDDFVLEQRFRNAKGVYQWHLTRCCGHRNEKGEILLWIGSSTNIQDQKEVQDAADVLSKKKDEFLGIASHELKTPITSLKASLQILDNLAEQEFDAKKLKTFVGMANKQVKKLNLIVEDLLDVTKIQSGKMKMSYSEYVLMDSIQDCLDEIRGTLFNRQIIIAGSADIRVSADRVRIEQVINNLLVNAVKYTPVDGQITITTKREHKYAKISIADNGIGIILSRQGLIFEKFSRAHESSQKYAGLGLGLFISSQIVAKHGGEIGVQSEEGKGSIFWFTIPLSQTQAIP
jgi:PAS domain S-box-containing protein